VTSISTAVNGHSGKRRVLDADTHLLRWRDENVIVAILAQDGGEQAHQFLPPHRCALVEPGTVACDADIDIAAMGGVPAFHRRELPPGRRLALEVC
jgi:hypothetical protein